MNFVNNYRQSIQLAAGATAADLSLPNGNYVLTLTDSATQPTRWEIVHATVVGGVATLVRGREGTADQLWPLGSVIYCALTAATLLSVMARLDALEAAEAPADAITFVIQAAQTVDGDFTKVGFDSTVSLGSMITTPAEIAGGEGIAVVEAHTSEMLYAETPAEYQLALNGTSSTPVTPGSYLLNGPGIPTNHPAELGYADAGGQHVWYVLTDFTGTNVLWSPGEITVTLNPA